MLESQIRKTLGAQANVANSPFLANQRAFYDYKEDVRWSPSALVIIAEDEYLPTQDQVAQTHLFGYSATALGCKLDFNSTETKVGAIRRLESDLQGFPSELFPLEIPYRDRRSVETHMDVAGYNRLRKYAMSLLEGIRSKLFLDLATAMIPEEGATALIRLGPLTTNDHLSLSSLLESKKLSIAAGLDTTQPDVGERNLFSSISNLPELQTQSNKKFRCMSDQQITTLLHDRERTGLFWRHGGRLPSESATFSAGSCYARLGDKRRFAPIRLDVVARAGELNETSSQLINFLARALLITPNSETLKNVSSILGGSNVAVPNFFEVLLQAIHQKRESRDTNLHRFYEREEANLL